MNTFFAVATVALSYLCLLLVANAAFVTEDEARELQMDTLQAVSGAVGELVYQGETFAQKHSGATPAALFRYERRVRTTPTGLEATHLTRDTAKQMVVTESAQFNTHYRLQRFAVDNRQLDYRGSVQVSSDGRRLSYRLNDRGTVSTAEESISLPAVSGPSLFGFILAHEQELAAGKTIQVRFIVMKKKQTYGLDIRQESATDGQVVYAITASSWLVRPLLSTMRATFDRTHKNWVRYEGRVPPMQTIAGKLADLDARVEYTAVAAAYR